VIYDRQHSVFKQNLYPGNSQRALNRLREAGVLERTPAGRWTPTVRFFARPLAEGPVPAGLPVLPTDGGDGHAIDAWLVRHPSRTVLVPVTGDSMLGAGIQPGDRVVVERDVPARPGDGVIAVIDNEFTLKTLAVDGGETVLVPANPAYPVLRPGERLQIFGVVVGLVRSYRR
jgi:repressor LexA